MGDGRCSGQNGLMPAGWPYPLSDDQPQDSMLYRQLSKQNAQLVGLVKGEGPALLMCAFAPWSSEGMAPASSAPAPAPTWRALEAGRGAGLALAQPAKAKPDGGARANTKTAGALELDGPIVTRSGTKTASALEQDPVVSPQPSLGSP